MTTTYIKRYLFDDRKLRERALRELTRCLRDGRLIAMTGSMSTESLGYFSWERMCGEFAEVAATVKEQFEKLFATAGGEAKRQRAARAFERFFGAPAPQQLVDLGGLTPGDFAVVARQLKHAPATATQDIVDLLKREVDCRPEYGARIGF